MRRFTIACLLLAMGLVLGIPTDWRALHTRGNGSGSNVESGNSKLLLTADPIGVQSIPGSAASTTTVPVSDQATRARVSEAIGKLPLIFEANQGQTDSQVKFLSRGGGYSLFLTSTEAVIQLRNASAKQASPGIGLRIVIG